MVACCGYWDNSIRCYSVDEGSLLQSVRVHKDIVTCIEVGSDGCTLASGVAAAPLSPPCCLTDLSLLAAAPCQAFCCRRLL